ncbi:unnamed protein product [Peniophora sp. CBMAI 1063]|nr:unnamed protein product [Peniophora sp. CBMAI 1063]
MKKSSDLEPETKDCAAARSILVAEGEVTSPELSRLDTRLRTLLAERAAAHKAKVRATHFVKGHHPGKYTSAINKPNHPRDIFTSLEKIDSPEAAEERNRRHSVLQEQGIPNQAPPAAQEIIPRRR